MPCVEYRVSNESESRIFDLVIIGAGQAGLTAGYHAKRMGLEAGRDFVMLDLDLGPGGAWQHRWDSLTFGRAHGIHDLPATPLGTPPTDIPASKVVREYYGRYEREHGLPVLRPWKVLSVESSDAASKFAPLIVTAENLVGERHSWMTRTVVNATGTWTRPRWPYYPGRESFSGIQIHTHDFVSVDAFAGKRVVVVGGGASAVQFLVPLSEVAASTTWATRRPPEFTAREFVPEGWGVDVERRVRERVEAGLPTLSVVGATGLPLWPDYVPYIESGVLKSRGMFSQIVPEGVIFPPVRASDATEYQPAWNGGLVEADAILWATGFSPAIGHLSPLRLREPSGGIRTDSTVVRRDPRVFLAGYAAGASTIGATRTGRRATLGAVKFARALKDGTATWQEPEDVSDAEVQAAAARGHRALESAAQG